MRDSVIGTSDRALRSSAGALTDHCASQGYLVSTTAERHTFLFTLTLSTELSLEVIFKTPPDTKSLTVGTLLGIIDGEAVLGTVVGVLVGVIVGIPVGMKVGVSDGVSVGFMLGVSVGTSVGIILGVSLRELG